MEEPVIRRPPQRVALLAHDRFGPFTSKTAIAVIRYGADDVVAVVDRSKMEADASEYIGRSGDGIPVVRSLSAAMAHGPEALIFGWAPEGGGLPAHDREEILGALRSGVDVISGLHTFLGDDEELLGAARIPLALPHPVPEWLSPLTCIVPGQLLAMHLAHARDLDVDSPRAIHKVTETH